MDRNLVQIFNALSTPRVAIVEVEVLAGSTT